MLGDKPVADALASPRSSLRSKLEYAADVSCDFFGFSTHEKRAEARRRSSQRVVDGKPVASRGDVFVAAFAFFAKNRKNALFAPLEIRTTGGRDAVRGVDAGRPRPRGWSRGDA